MIFIFLLSFTLIANCQKIIISGKETSRPLVWQDFSGTPDNSSPFYALTWWTIKYKYDRVEFTGNDATLIGFEVQLELNPSKSWVKTDKQTDMLLQHEQQHFNIGILCMRELIADINMARLKKDDYNDVVRNLFQAMMTRYKAMDIKYDEETNHGAIREQQEKWNEFISKELAK
ncbi:MAG: DUF922 domain-containing protein [Flavisolibacter sp.]